MAKSASAPARSRWGVRAHPNWRFARRTVSLACLLLGFALGLLATAPTALAHGGDESQEGYLLVQQALGHLAHDTSHTGIDLAMEKVGDALAAEDHDGVAIPQVTQAKAALEAGQVESARSLLQDSIKVALSELPPAVGNETGTKLIAPRTARPRGPDGFGLATARGLRRPGCGRAGDAFVFRPRDSVGVLRRRLGGQQDSGAGHGGLEQVKADGSP